MRVRHFETIHLQDLTVYFLPCAKYTHSLVVCACVSAQSCWTLCDLMDWSLPWFSVHGILQARMLEEVAISSARDLPDPGIEPMSPVSPELVGLTLYH